MKKLVHSVMIVTLEEENPVIKNGYVIISDRVFERVAEGRPSEEEIRQCSELIDGDGKWLMPGLINTHGHLGSAFLRGAGDDMPLMTWLQTVMWPNEAKFTEEDVEAAASLAMVEMIKSGTTTFLDMYHLFMDTIGELTIQSGMRGVLCRGMIGDCSEEEQRAKLEDSLQLYRKFHGEADGRVTVALSPHAPYTCPPSFLEKVIEAALENKMWVHTHLSETRGEVERHLEQYGKRPVEHLNELGFFQVPTLIAHGVHLTEKEMDILVENKVSVAHNPMSNLKLGSGIAPISAMLKKGIQVSLGTDSTASNNNLDLFEEMRFAALIHKGASEDPTATSSADILKMATISGAKALQFNQLGKIKEGYDADFILLDHHAAHLQPWDESRVISHLIYAAKGSDVTDSFVQGEQLMKNREVISLDEEKILARAKEFKLS